MPRENRFYVEYLGWKETRGLYGAEFTDPVVRKLVGNPKVARGAHRMTIKVTRDNIHISQSRAQPNGRTEKVKYPPVQLCDVSFVLQSPPPNADIVSCIFLGYNHYTRCASHVHAYRFDSASTAATFARLLRALTDQAEYKERILAMERDLYELGQLHQPLSLDRDGLGSDGAQSNGCHSPNSSDSGYGKAYPSAEEALRQRKDIVIKKSPRPAPAAPAAMTLRQELEQKLSLQQTQAAPILLPPKDYDTIVRRHGHLSIRAKVKQRSIVGFDNIFGDPPAPPAAPEAAVRTSKVNRLSNLSSRSSSTESPDNDSTAGSLDEPISVYGLYKGLNDDGYTSAADDMAMWSPEFSFDHQSARAATGRGSEGGGSARRKV